MRLNQPINILIVHNYGFIYNFLIKKFSHTSANEKTYPDYYTYPGYKQCI